ncbi:MAG: FAD-dependent oxidoreductase [Bryobacteraceae bacterium]
MRATLTGWRDLAPAVRHFEFEAEAPVEFLPGQFISLTAELEGLAITRAYSLASAPDGSRFSLCLNRVSDGHMSPHLFAMNVGGAVEFKGPLGGFTIRNPDRERVYVATGTGVAPFRSMLEQQFATGAGTPVTLVFGVRYAETILYRDEFERWALEHPCFDFRPTLSRPGPEWTGRAGHVQSHAIETIGGRRDLDIYICGLKLMVDDMRARLKELGFERRQIITEKYD